MNLPKDVAAYLIEAAQIIAKEQGFTPESEIESARWMRANMRAIAAKASELQIDTYNRFSENQETVTKIMAAKVWGDIRRQDATAQENQAIARVLK
jgi:hypothetical protein